MREECARLADGWRFEANPGGDGATIAELLRDRRGRCLELARLLVWRLRLRSIPARFVLGYALEPTTRGAIRQRHAWVAYHDGRRWMTVDPSAPGRCAGDLFATAWGPRLSPLMPVRARRPHRPHRHRRHLVDAGDCRLNRRRKGARRAAASEHRHVVPALLRRTPLSAAGV